MSGQTSAMAVKRASWRNKTSCSMLKFDETDHHEKESFKLVVGDLENRLLGVLK